MIVLIIILSIIILAAVLLMIPLYVNIQYVFDAKNSRARIYLKYLFFTIELVPSKKKDKPDKKKKKESKIDEPENKKFTFDMFKSYMDKIYAIREDIFDVLSILFNKAVYIKDLSIYSEFGFEDPMTTGIVTGAANTVVYNMLSVIERHANLEQRTVSLIPDFDNPHFLVRIKSIIKIKNVHIIVIVLKLLGIFFKIK